MKAAVSPLAHLNVSRQTFTRRTLLLSTFSSPFQSCCESRAVVNLFCFRCYSRRDFPLGRAGHWTYRVGQELEGHRHLPAGDSGGALPHRTLYRAAVKRHVFLSKPITRRAGLFIFFCISSSFYSTENVCLYLTCNLQCHSQSQAFLHGFGCSLRSLLPKLRLQEQELLQQHLHNPDQLAVVFLLQAMAPNSLVHRWHSMTSLTGASKCTIQAQSGSTVEK